MTRSQGLGGRFGVRLPSAVSGFGVEAVRVVADPVPRVLAHLLEPELRRPPGEGEG